MRDVIKSNRLIMRSLAAELNVDPLKLLTHFLVYEKEV